MLILSRKNGQSFTIANAKITVWTKGGVVKVGIEAPKEVRILRSELEAKEQGK